MKSRRRPVVRRRFLNAYPAEIVQQAVVVCGIVYSTRSAAGAIVRHKPVDAVAAVMAYAVRAPLGRLLR